MSETERLQAYCDRLWDALGELEDAVGPLVVLTGWWSEGGTLAEWQEAWTRVNAARAEARAALREEPQP